MAEENGPEKQVESGSSEALLNLMRFWLFGTWIIVTGSTFAYIAMFANKRIGPTLAAGWPIWVITAVLCVIVYFAYAWYIGRKS